MDWTEYKNKALTSHKGCTKGYNPRGVPSGFDSESAFGVERKPNFHFWKEKFKEEKARDHVLQFMDFYDIDFLEYPGSK